MRFLVVYSDPNFIKKDKMLGHKDGYVIRSTIK